MPTQENLKRIADLYIECFNAPEKGENWTKETAYQYLLDRKAEGSIFTTLRDDENIDIICCGSDYKTSFILKDLEFDPEHCAYISLLAMRNKYRDQGLSTRIIKAYCNLLNEKGFQNFLIRCRSDNKPMLSVLKKSDFKVITEYNSELGGVTCKRSVLLRAMVKTPEDKKELFMPAVKSNA